MRPGRKTLKDELKVIERYSELSGPYFTFIRKMLAGGKKDKRWASEQLKGAYIKMLPQAIGGTDGQPIVIRIIDYSHGGAEKTLTQILPSANKEKH